MRKLCLRIILGLTISLFFIYCSKEQIPSLDQAIIRASLIQNKADIQARKNQIILGVIGQPINQSAYFNTPAYTQIRMLKDMNMAYYKIYISTDEDGSIANEPRFNELITAAVENNVKLLPMLWLDELDYTNSVAGAYKKGKAQGSGFAKKYGQSLDYYELGSQLESKLINSSAVDGSSSSHYDQAKFKVLAAFLKGMNEGIKANDKGAKTIINATWKHYAYLQMLENEGINFDVVGYNWYSNMGSEAAISAKLASLFKKPIWFTGIFFKNGTYGNTEEDQKEWINNFIVRVKPNPSVKAVFIYELLDQPGLKNSPQTEKHQGLIKWESPYTESEYKLAGQSFLTVKSPAPSTTGKNLILGINGHPLNQVAYFKTPVSRQIDLLKDLNMSYYRVDVATDRFGNVISWKRFDPLVAATAARGIKLLPMLWLTDLDYTVNAASAYHRGKTVGSGFAKRYRNNIDYYELGNEEESKILLSPGLDGSSPSHYDQKKFNILAAYLKGMDEGIKANDPGAKTIIDAGWKHYGYLKMLEKAGVGFDIVGYHWYSNMDSVDPFTMLTDIFQKPIWFTEVSYRNGSLNGKEAQQSEWTKNFVNKCRQAPAVKAVFFYELFDQPSLVARPKDRDYGVVKWTNSFSNWRFKAVGKYFNQL